MEVLINDIAFEVPFDPEIIMLQDFILYHNEYGSDLKKKLKEVIEKKYDDDEEINELERSIELEKHLDEEALCWYSFWTKYDLHEVKDHPGIIPFLERYRVLRSLLKEDTETSVEYPVEILWEGDIWMIQDFKVSPASEMSFNEIITSKEIMRQVYAIGQDNWAALPYLCAVFLRKKDELFTDGLIQEGSERLNLFNQLPLKHALSVAFFLNISVNTWSRALAYSAKKDLGTASLN